MVHCKLGHLFQIIEAEGLAVHESVTFVKGTFMIVLAGQLDGTQLWHVCSFREATLAMEDPESFARLVREGPFFKSMTSNPEIALQQYVLVGALITPCSSARIAVCEFDYNLAPDRRGKVFRKGLTEMQRLQFDRITYQGQLSMGVQGPQGTLAVGGESGRAGDPPELKEFNLGNVQNVFGQAIDQQILLFQTAPRIISEQNLFNIVVSAIVNLIPCKGNTRSVESRSSDVRDIIKTLFTVNSDLHRSYRALHRISTNSVFTAHHRKNLITGIDLTTLIRTDKLLVLCEEKWTSGSALESEIGTLPCLAVHSLEPSSQNFPRSSPMITSASPTIAPASPMIPLAAPMIPLATLFITVRLVEEMIGSLYQVTSQLSGSHVVFMSENGITLELTDVTSEIITAVRGSWEVPVLTWDAPTTIITPGEILAGGRPAVIKIPDAVDRLRRWIAPWVTTHVGSPTGRMGIRLGAFVNGVESLCYSELGVLISCE